MVRASRFLSFLAILSLALACGPRGARSPLEPLERAARAAEGGSEKGSTLALASWHAWLVQGQAERAEALAKVALEDDDGLPLAHLALAEAARRRVDPAAETESLLLLLERAPAHPLAILAAERLGTLAGRSLLADDLQLERIPRILENGVPGEVASRLRHALLQLLRERDTEGYMAVARDAGRMSEVSLAGPSSPWSYLEISKGFPSLEVGPIQAPEGAPLRRLSTPDGFLSLAPEPSSGDVFHSLSMVTVPRQGRYLVRLRTAPSTHASLFLDGVTLLQRSSFGAVAPTLLSREVELQKGSHLLSVRIGRGRGAGEVSVEIAPADGSPSPVTYRAAALGDGATIGGTKIAGPVREPARALANLLEEEVGILAAWAGAGLGYKVDPEGTKLLLGGALEELPGSLPLLALQAKSWAYDGSLPRRIASGRATADLEKVLAKDPGHLHARLHLSSLHREAGRFDDAEAALQAATAANATAAILVERARLAGERGFDALVHSLAWEAFAAEPDHCEAGDLAFVSSRRAKDVEGSSKAARDLASCPGGKRRILRLAMEEGRLREALEIGEGLASLHPEGIGPALSLAEVHLAGGAPGKAAEVIGALASSWPRTARLERLRSRHLVGAGKIDDAREARRRALALDGSDLPLLLLEAFEEGREILAERDPKGLEAIRAFEARGETFDAPAITLIDFVGIEVREDGSQIERTHVLTKILDKRGVDLLGEVHLPDGAEILELRTIKGDGRILEPERIDAKDSISMPGLDVGDFIEYQYLRSRPAQEAALPGWSSQRFFFRTNDVPILDSTFLIRVDKRADLAIDRHGGAPVGEIIDEGTHLTFLARSENNPAYIPEPGAVHAQEVLPWLQVGEGAGEKELACFFGDRLLGAERRSLEVERWAREAASGAQTPAQQVRRVWDRLMEEVEGEGSFDTPAPSILAHKRGNRAVLLKAALDALGIETSWVALRTFQEDPNPYRFPHASRLGKFVLVSRPDPAGGWLWMDPSTRWAPLGEVAADVQGMPGWVLPGGTGEADCFPTTAPLAPHAGRKVELHLQLLPGGSLEGKGTESYQGFEGARARIALERMTEESLRQVVETSLVKGFRDMVLGDLELKTEGGEVKVTYTFQVPNWGHPSAEGSRILDLDFAREDLGKRFLAGAKRETPLLLGAPERSVLEVEILLPRGTEIVFAPQAAREQGKFGSFRRAVAVIDEKVVIRDELSLERARVLPHEYGELTRWVQAVDRALMEELVVQPPLPPAPPREEETSPTPQDAQELDASGESL